MANQRQMLEELLQDLRRAQASVSSAESNIGIAARTAERTPLMGTFISPVQDAARTCASVWWQLEGHIASVKDTLARLPAAEPIVLSHARHA